MANSFVILIALIAVARPGMCAQFSTVYSCKFVRAAAKPMA
jgi:hypothetical protein